MQIIDISTYTNRIIYETKVDLQKRPVNPPIHFVQYDDRMPILAVTLLNNGYSYTLPTDVYAINLRYTKKDGTFVIKEALGISEARQTVYFEMTDNMLAMDGPITATVKIYESTDSEDEDEGEGYTVSTSPIYLIIDRATVQPGQIKSTDVLDVPLHQVAFSGDYNDLNNLPDDPGGGSDAVKYVPQQLTASQKDQARENIDALSSKPDGTNPLIENGKITETYIPDSVLGQLEYCGSWDASTGVSQLTRNPPRKGDYYIASVGGTYLPDGTEYDTAFQTGDWALVNNDAGGEFEWIRIANTDAVTMVNGRTGAIETYRGAWNSSLTYNKGDIVSAVKNGKSVFYIAKRNVAQNMDPTSELQSDNWGSFDNVQSVNGRTGAVDTFQGDWSSTTAYQKGDVVYHAASSSYYMAKLGGTGNIPNAPNSNYWFPISSNGGIDPELLPQFNAQGTPTGTLRNVKVGNEILEVPEGGEGNNEAFTNLFYPEYNGGGTGTLAEVTGPNLSYNEAFDVYLCHGKYSKDGGRTWLDPLNMNLLYSQSYSSAGKASFAVAVDDNGEGLLWQAYINASSSARYGWYKVHINQNRDLVIDYMFHNVSASDHTIEAVYDIVYFQEYFYVRAKNNWNSDTTIYRGANTYPSEGSYTPYSLTRMTANYNGSSMSITSVSRMGVTKGYLWVANAKSNSANGAHVYVKAPTDLATDAFTCYKIASASTGRKVVGFVPDVVVDGVSKNYIFVRSGDSTDGYYACSNDNGATLISGDIWSLNTHYDDLSLYDDTDGSFVVYQPYYKYGSGSKTYTFEGIYKFYPETGVKKQYTREYYDKLNLHFIDLFETYDNNNRKYPVMPLVTQGIKCKDIYMLKIMQSASDRTGATIISNYFTFPNLSKVTSVGSAEYYPAASLTYKAYAQLIAKEYTLMKLNLAEQRGATSSLNLNSTVITGNKVTRFYLDSSSSPTYGSPYTTITGGNHSCLLVCYMSTTNDNVGVYHSAVQILYDITANCKFVRYGGGNGTPSWNSWVKSGDHALYRHDFYAEIEDGEDAENWDSIWFSVTNTNPNTMSKEDLIAELGDRGETHLQGVIAMFDAYGIEEPVTTIALYVSREEDESHLVYYLEPGGVSADIRSFTNYNTVEI